MRLTNIGDKLFEDNKNDFKKQLIMLGCKLDVSLQQIMSPPTKAETKLNGRKLNLAFTLFPSDNMSLVLSIPVESYNF